MATCREALELICFFEGYIRKLPDGRAAPYLDPVGIPTIGYGSIWRRDGTRVAMSDPPITHEEALDLMQLELTKKCEPAVDRLIAVPMHSLMRGALISFAYNLGSGALKASTLRKVINAQDWGRVRREFAKYRVAGGRVLPGLVRRRAAEADMFLKGVKFLEQPIAEDETWTAMLEEAA
jgi:lysozyme